MRELLARGAQRHPIVVYTVARLCIFVAVALPLRVIGLTGLMWLAMSLMISGMISLFVLDGVRSQFGGRVSGFFQRLNRRIDDATRAEDEDSLADEGQAQAESESRQ